MPSTTSTHFHRTTSARSRCWNHLLRVSTAAIAICTAAAAIAARPAIESNTATGNGALSSNTTGTNNSAYGYQALFGNTTGSANTASGAQSLFSNTTASGNTADGFLALFANTSGAANTALGSQALNFSTVGNENTGAGSNALFNNTTGNDNTATGANAGHNNTTGAFNTVSGATALYSNTTGSFNTANGSFALNLSTGSNNIAVGYAAGINLTTGDQNIDVGNPGVAGESGTIRIGTPGNQVAAFMAGVNSAPVAGLPVVVDGNGQLGVSVSSARFKEGIKPMASASESILGLKPVTFRYKESVDACATPQFGLIAEEVAKINPDLVVRDRDGKIYTVRYEAVNAMLLNEFLKEHHKVETLESTVGQQKEQIANLATLLEKAASRIQKVETQVELRGSTTQIADSGR